MKMCGFFHGILFNDKIVLKPRDPKDWVILNKLFKSKKDRETRSGKEILLKVEIDADFQKRSFKQLNAVWKLVTIIFQSDSENHRLPTSDEKYDLYLDLLDIYGDKRVNRFNSQLLTPIHISESKTIHAAHFIDGLLYHLASSCSLPMDLQSSVRDIIYQWEIWRGKQEIDINDNRSIDDMREKILYSEASGRCENIEFAHFVSRGSSTATIDEPWNLVALTHDEHIEIQHKFGWGEFLSRFPHLKGRYERARDMAGKLYKDIV